MFVLSPGASTAGCGLLKVGGLAASGSAGPDCGFQLGDQVAALDCDQAKTAPAGIDVDSFNYDKSTSGGGSVDYPGGVCRLGAPAYNSLTEFRLNSATPPDLVAVADFIPTAAGDQYSGFTFRCVGDTCLYAYVVHSGTFYVEDLMKGESSATTLKKGAASVQLNQPNRLVAWIRNQKIDLWLNGRLLASVAVRVDQPAGGQVAKATSFFIQNYDKSSAETVDVQRFYVFGA
jgi:hypothetical protein